MSDLTTLEDNFLPKPLNQIELHRLAMNIVGKELEADNFDFLSVNSLLNSSLKSSTFEERFGFNIRTASYFFICFPMVKDFYLN